MLKGLIQLSVILFSLPLLAEVEFVSPENPQWESETLQLMEDVNNMLPADWKRPQDFKVALVPNGEPSYYPLFRYQTQTGQNESVDKLLVVSDSSPEKFVHEYAHLVFDVLLRNRSNPWRYHLAWQKVSYNDISESLSQYKKHIESLQKTNEEFVQKKEQGDNSEMVANIIRNTARSVEKYKDLVVILKKAQEIELNSDYPLDQFNAFEALEAANELFADLVASLYFENWQAMKDSTLKDIAETDLEDRLLLPPLESREEALEAYLNHRSFQQGLLLSEYDFKEWEARGPYMQFAPVRSYLRDLLDSGLLETRPELINLLAQSIMKVYHEDWLKEPSLVESPLFDKNQLLIETMEEKLSR